MIARALWLPVVLIVLAASPSPLRAREDEEPALRFDPFSVPELEELVRETETKSREGTQSKRGPASAWEPVLRATLVADDASLANLGGTVLSPGEESHGWTLVEVRRFEAVFLHQGERVVLTVTRPEGQR